ncbi:phenylacetate--CoA ligase family protein [Streptomyces sp. NPDC058623]|uniref:phenylacetate--CoA ligase family protein n=1 Tax=Streptomyces sp. NPDC058623 TaxID=3346563 RepID=UPI003651816C
MTHYPTDLLIAVGQLDARLAAGHAPDVVRQLSHAGVTDPGRILDSEQLAEGLDLLLGGVSQYPWQPLTDSNSVLELSPVGEIVLDDHQAEATLRGLLLGWATGNGVTIRTTRPQLWRTVMDALHGTGLPLPDGRTAAPGDEPAGLVVEVPVLPEGAVLALDCQAAWARTLLRSRHLPGTSIAQVRSRDTAGQAGRLDAKLRYLVQQARRTPYYRELPDVRGTADIALLPVLEKADLEAHSLPASRDLCSGATPSGEVLRSGATSGEPRFIVYSRTDWDNMVREAVPVWYELGVEPGDRIINTLFGGGMYGGLTTTFSEFTRMPVECYSTGQHATVDDMLMLTRSFDANVILGMPALILPLLRDAKARHPGLRMEKVLYGGTPMTESDKTWLREELGARVVTSILAANDGAQLGYQCAGLGGTLHHVNDDYNLIEVVDEDGRAAPDGAPGQLLITSMQKFEGPLIRYRIGDIGRVFTHACVCGVSGKVLEYLGRSDGLVRFKGETVLYSEILELLGDFQVSQLQIEIASRDSKEVLTVRTESPHRLDSRAVREHLIAKVEVLGDVQDFDAGLDAFEFVVECAAEGELARNGVSGKIKPVIDRRLEQR